MQSSAGRLKSSVLFLMEMGILSTNAMHRALRPFTIVGIVADSKYNDVRERTTDPVIWTPLAQFVIPVKSLLLRTRAGNEPVSDF